MMLQPEQQPGPDVIGQGERAPDVIEGEKTEGVVVFEDLRGLGDEAATRVKVLTEEAMEHGMRQVEGAVTSSGGGSEDAEVGRAAIDGVHAEMQQAAVDTQQQIAEAVGVESEAGGELVKLNDNYDKAQLAELRAKTRDDYGDGLVSTHHKGAETVAEHEEAQRKAYEGLSAKIEAGVVKPDAIQSDLLSHLRLREAPEASVENVGEIADLVAQELQEFHEHSEIAVNENEVKLIQAEAEKFAQVYQEAFPDVSSQQVYEVTRDNVRKLAYQTSLDKRVFSGSDHGTRHILEGNMKWADKMLDSLGDRATTKDKVLIRQIIIDHDLGYTTGVAQAEKSFAASKDHPIFSAGFIDANQEYYTQMFGEDGYEMIRDGILQHSYVQSEYASVADPEKGFNPDLIRSVTSTVDALGVTAETKCPAFFRQPDVVRVMQKVRLYTETHDNEVPSDVLEKYKGELREIAGRESNPDRRRAFDNAIEKQFNPTTVEMTLGQYAGVMTNIELEERDGELVPHVSMDISKTQALLGDLFGDEMSTKAFMKAMADFGVPKEAMSEMASVIRQLRKEEDPAAREKLMAQLRFDGPKSSFTFAPEFNEADPEIAAVFEEYERTTISNEVYDLMRGLKLMETRTAEGVSIMFEKFKGDLGEQVDELELQEIEKLGEWLIDSVDSDDDFELAMVGIISFTTRREREFMGID